jgi:hypothetical protein
MALRTAQTRAYLLGEATKRDEWGVNTVIVNKRGVACPLCLKYVGKVFYDDVWGNSPIPSPAQYPLLSKAIEGGLYHPNCKDIHTTYFEGISTPPEPMTEAEKKEAARVYNLEQQQRYNERQIRKYKRLSDGSVDPENRDRYYKKLSEWQETQNKFVKANGDVLKRRYETEKIHGIGPIDNADTRRTVAQMRREVALEKLQLSKNSGKILTNSAKGGKMDLQFFASKEKQFGKKVGKHAIDFGLDPSKAEDREKFQNIIDEIMGSANEIRIGEWRGQSEEVLFHIQGEDVVITDQQNEFITILKGGVNNARVKKARNR